MSEQMCFPSAIFSAFYFSHLVHHGLLKPIFVFSHFLIYNSVDLLIALNNGDDFWEGACWFHFPLIQLQTCSSNYWKGLTKLPRTINGCKIFFFLRFIAGVWWLCLTNSIPLTFQLYIDTKKCHCIWIGYGNNISNNVVLRWFSIIVSLALN